MSAHRDFFERHIPTYVDDPAFTSLRGLSDVVAIRITNGSEEERHHLWFENGTLQQGDPPRDQAVRTEFRLSDVTFARAVAGELSPQVAFFTMRLAIEGDVLFGLQLGTLLAGFFKRHPWRAEETAHA